MLCHQGISRQDRPNYMNLVTISDDGKSMVINKDGKCFNVASLVEEGDYDVSRTHCPVWLIRRFAGGDA